MDSLKTLLVVGVLGAVAYLVYASITNNQGPDLQGPDGGFANAPATQIPGQEATATQENAKPGAATPTPSATSLRPLPAGTAPSHVPTFPAGENAIPSSNPHRPLPSAAAGTPAGLMQMLSDRSAPDWFNTFMQTVRMTRYGNGPHQARPDEALEALSRLHGDPTLNEGQASLVRTQLNELAAEVIYSRSHWLVAAHTVREGETLQQIAPQYNVPWQLLGKINGIVDPNRLQPGSELKVVPGPFNARIDLAQHELTLMLGDRFAGTFGIGVGQDAAARAGLYLVTQKREYPAYSAPGGSLAGGAPNNPYGKLILYLGTQQETGSEAAIGIHGTNNPLSLHVTSGPGGIRLAARDIEDVFGILSEGTFVEIR